MFVLLLRTAMYPGNYAAVFGLVSTALCLFILVTLTASLPAVSNTRCIPVISIFRETQNQVLSWDHIPGRTSDLFQNTVNIFFLGKF